MEFPRRHIRKSFKSGHHVLKNRHKLTNDIQGGEINLMIQGFSENVQINEEDEHSKIRAKDLAAEQKKKILEQNKHDFGKNFSPVLIIAIDFGTTFSGFALSFKGSRENILTAKHGNRLPADRVPTIILLDPEQRFKSFGFEAMEDYARLSDKEKSKYFYIQHFKMALYYSNRLSRKTMVLDSNNREVNALQIFSMTIKYFKDLALEMADEGSVGLAEEYVQWVITIPAIWTDSARQFMREAATQAGIRPENLRLVLEPEAASIFCQEITVVANDAKIEELPVGDKYILADLGGGTVDICAHEILEDGKLRELYRATGGDFGGKLVNEKYLDFILEVFGEKVFNNFKEKYLQLYFEMEKDFEKKKTIFSTKMDGSVTFSPECALLNILEKESGNSFLSILQKSKYKKNVVFNEETGRLSIKKEVMESFFQCSVDGIIMQLKEVLTSCSEHDIQTLMLVGGYAESPYLREIIQTEFTNTKVILHQDTRLAVLKGAVMMGYMPRNIVQRRARFTYGFILRVPFIPGEHPESLKSTEDGEDWCMGIFDKLIEKGQLLEYGDTFIRERYETAVDPELKHKKLYTQLWRSTRENPHYCVDEEGEEDCEGVGYIVHKPPPDGWPVYWESERHLIVGESEFTMKYMNITTGEECETQVDFL